MFGWLKDDEGYGVIIELEKANRDCVGCEFVI